MVHFHFTCPSLRAQAIAQLEISVFPPYERRPLDDIQGPLSTSWSRLLGPHLCRGDCKVHKKSNNNTVWFCVAVTTCITSAQVLVNSTPIVCVFLGYFTWPTHSTADTSRPIHATDGRDGIAHKLHHRSNCRFN